MTHPPGHATPQADVFPASSAMTSDTRTNATAHFPISAQIAQLAKQPRLVRERARCLQWAGAPTQGQQLLAASIQAGGWTRTGLWWELVAFMESPKDHQLIRELWLHSPASCHENPAVLRAVARSAAVAGEHHECRTLLRKLIVISGKAPSADTPVGVLRSARGAISALLSHGAAPANEHEPNRKFAEQAAESLVDLNDAFSRVGLDAFLISGTLLGLVRDDGIIGWDKDIDVGFFKENCDTDLNAFFRQHGKFRIGRVDLSSERLRVIHRNGMWIDVFPHYLENGRRWHDGTATRWWNTPFGLKKVSFLGMEQFVPDNPELYLEENYGDWQIPTPHFDARMDAPNVEVSDPEHFVSLLYFSLEKSIRENKEIMKKRYIELLREHGEGAWLDRL